MEQVGVYRVFQLLRYSRFASARLFEAIMGKYVLFTLVELNGVLYSNCLTSEMK